jgi:hypothetical protein
MIDKNQGEQFDLSQPTLKINHIGQKIILNPKYRFFIGQAKLS